MLQTGHSEQSSKAPTYAQDSAHDLSALGDLSAPELAALAQQMLARINQQSQHIAEQDQVIAVRDQLIARRERELKFKTAALERITLRSWRA